MAYQPTDTSAERPPGLRSAFDDLVREPDVAGTLTALTELASWYTARHY